MNKLILILLLTSQNLFAQGTVSSTCIWSGAVADCLPSAGLLLRNQRDLRLGEASVNGSNYIAIQAPSALASDFTLTMPIDDGTASQFLQTDGSGVLTWANPLTPPMTTRGDLIRGGVSGAAERFAAVTNNRVVRGNGSDVVSGQIDSPNFFTTGAEVTQSLPGVVSSAGQLLGTNTNDNAAAGYVGQFIENARTTATPTITSSTYTSIDSGNVTFNDNNETGITLTAGDWDISAVVNFQPVAATASNFIVFVGTAKGTGTTGSLAYANTVHTNYSTSGQTVLTVPTWRVSLTSSTTYYLKARATYTGTAVNAVGSLRARRFR